MKRKLALLLTITLTAAAIPFSAAAASTDAPADEVVEEVAEVETTTSETDNSQAEDETGTTVSDPVTEDLAVPQEGSQQFPEEEIVLPPEEGSSEETPVSTDENTPESTDDLTGESSENGEEILAEELEEAEAGTIPKITAAGWDYFNNGWHLYYVDPADNKLKARKSEWVDFPADSTVTKPDISVVLTDASTTNAASTGTQNHTLNIVAGSHFFDADGNYAISGPFKTTDKGIQYFDKDGFIQTGWVMYDGVWHYFEEDTGLIVSGWKYLKEDEKVRSQETNKKVTLKKGWHYFDETGVQVVEKVVMTPDKGLQFFDPDGVRKVGFQRWDGQWYCFDKTTGAIIDGWKYCKSDKKATNYKTGGTYTFKAGWHYFDSQGHHFKKGLYDTPDKGTQYFNAYGVRKVGYIKIDGKWYHFKKETGMDKGLVYLSAKTVSGTKFGKGYHYFDPETGEHKTKVWRTIDGERYRFGDDGAAYTGWAKISGVYYHFTSKGVMEKSKTVSGIKLGSDGKATVSGAKAEMIIKVQNKSSSTSWLCCTDKDNHKVGIFKGYKGHWELVKYWPVAVGAWVNGKSKTPSGDYRIAYKQYRMTHLTSFYYVSWTTAGVGYHSQLYSINVYSHHNPIVDHSMSCHISNGCMRLYLDNAIWIYNNVPTNSAVYIYGR